jgi:glycerol uptake facilitator protein
MRVRRIIAEFLGIMILSTGICLTDGDPFAAGASLWVAIIGTGFVSGAQFNPAITTAVILVGLVKRKISKEDLLEHFVYYACHFSGAFAGGLMAWAIRSETFELTIHTSPGRAYLGEVSATTALILVAMIGGELKDSHFINTLAVAVTLFVGLYTVGPYTGGCLNPAMGLAANWTDSINHTHQRARHIYVYLLGPFTASAVAAALFLLINPELERIYKLKEANQAARASTA